MTTERKIVLAMTGAVFIIMTGIGAYFSKRIDDRSEAEHQAIMAKINDMNVRVDSLATEKTDE